jgi:hypothetical protein
MTRFIFSCTELRCPRWLKEFTNSKVAVYLKSYVLFVTDFYSEETVNNQGLECLRFLNEVISDFDAVCMQQS